QDPELRTRRPLLFESFVETSDVEQNGGAPIYEGTTPTVADRPNTAVAARAGGPQRSAATSTAGTGPTAGASIVAPPKDYEGIRLGPYKYIEWPDGEKELYDINK